MVKRTDSEEPVAIFVTGDDLCAIRARLDGEWDHPVLMRLGDLLQTRLEDVRRILEDTDYDKSAGRVAAPEPATSPCCGRVMHTEDGNPDTLWCSCGLGYAASDFAED